MMDMPRALSTDDAAYGEFVATLDGVKISVTLDGVEVADDAKAYDLDAQTVTRPVRDDQGNIMLTDDREAIRYVVVEGKVEVGLVTIESPSQ